MAQSSNDKTVVGVFEDYNAADRVVRELTNAGIPRESVQVQSNFMTGAAGRSEYGENQNREGGISGFFSRLFGGDDRDAGNYAEAHRRGNAIVTVTAPCWTYDRPCVAPRWLGKPRRVVGPRGANPVPSPENRASASS